MGRLRAPYLNAEWGRQIVAHMRAVKTLFDPEGIFNPGVMFSSDPITKDMRVA
jgi:D-lactate dehydrogenase